MKKLLSLLITFLFSAQLSAQTSSNLGFSQVLNFEYSHTMPKNSLSPALDMLTVPNNKVWKITSGSAYNSNDYNFSTSIHVGKHVISAGDLMEQFNNCPVWLSSGNYEVFLGCGTGNTNTVYTIRGALTIIEFNVE